MPAGEAAIAAGGLSLMGYSVPMHLAPGPANVRYAPNSDRILRRSEMTLCAMCGRLRVGKDFLRVCSIGRCSHVFGLLARHTGPLVGFSSVMLPSHFLPKSML